MTKRKLTYGSQSLYTPPANWTDDEDKQLTQFVLLNSLGDKWPTLKSNNFWEGASDFLARTCGSCRRTGGRFSAVVFCQSVQHPQQKFGFLLLQKSQADLQRLSRSSATSTKRFGRNFNLNEEFCKKKCEWHVLPGVKVQICKNCNYFSYLNEKAGNIT